MKEWTPKTAVEQLWQFKGKISLNMEQYKEGEMK